MGSALQMDTGVVRDLILRQTVQHFPGGSMNFERFEMDNIDECVRFVKDLVERSAKVNGVSVEEMKKGVKIVLTGGSEHKSFGEALGGVDMRKEGEMERLIEELKFIMLVPDEAYYFSDELIDAVAHPHSAAGSKYLNAVAAEGGVLPCPSPNPPKYAVMLMSNPTPQLPCLLVNIRSGVSIIEVDEDGTFEHVSGTSLGGSTLWGLLSLMTPATTFNGEPSTTISYASAVPN
jgi:type II pantothenate kinase